MKQLTVHTEVPELERFYDKHPPILCDENEIWVETIPHKRAEIATVDPGLYNGLAVVIPDATLLSTIRPEYVVTQFTSHDRVPHVLAVERPLHGAVRVYDPMPWQVYGLLSLWTQAWHPRIVRFIPADVGWLKAGRNLARLTPKLPDPHVEDAFAHLNYLVAQERV